MVYHAYDDESGALCVRVAPVRAFPTNEGLEKQIAKIRTHGLWVVQDIRYVMPQAIVHIDVVES